MNILITVGTFQFDELVLCLLRNVNVLTEKFGNFLRIFIQYGCHSQLKLSQLENTIESPVEFFPFLLSIEEFIRKNDVKLVIAHGGAGTLVELIGKVNLICIPNHTLMDNHQEEFIQELHRRDLITMATLTSLPIILNNFQCRKINETTTAIFDKELQKALFIS